MYIVVEIKLMFCLDVVGVKFICIYFNKIEQDCNPGNSSDAWVRTRNPLAYQSPRVGLRLYVYRALSR